MKTYSANEVRALVEDYDTVKVMLDTNRRGIKWVCYHVDIHKAYLSLSRPQRGAILLHGFIGFGLETAAEMEGIGKSQMHRRYMRGLEAMAHYLNGGTSA